MYLHYVLDQWVQWWRRKYARGDVIIVRFADDFTAGFEHLGDAKQFMWDLRERFAKFSLQLHPDKTRLIGKWLSAGVIEDGTWSQTVEGAPQGGLCSAEHNAPNEQCWVMRSVGLLGLVRAGPGVERCA